MEMKQSILVAEDEAIIRMLLKDYLQQNEYTVIEAENGEEALIQFDKQTVDLVLLDIMMPKIDGFKVCEKIREKSDVPIIFLTARTQEEDELRGFDLKANDYIKKPFSPAVVVARVKRALQQKNILEKGIVSLNKQTMELKIEGQKIDLTTKEFQIFQYLMENERIIFSREQMLDHIWGYDFEGDLRIVDTHIKKIRKALGEYSYLIRTVFGAGYKFEVGE
jgi:DNA-binding response OmpR family regulator